MFKSFFPMRSGEAWMLAGLIAFSVVSFLPAWRTTMVFGMAAFGWWMAALMVLSPALTLWVFLKKP